MRPTSQTAADLLSFSRGDLALVVNPRADLALVVNPRADLALVATRAAMNQAIGCRSFNWFRCVQQEVLITPIQDDR